MKNSERQSNSAIYAIVAVACIMVLALFSQSQAAGLLKPKHGGGNISIKSHDVKVVINNGFARTEVDQVFINEGDNDLEAIYSFPLPRRASLSELSLWIDGQEVVGEVVEKEKARKIYQQQKAKGKQTALAENDSYKTFDVAVYPVKAKDETRIRMVYYQPLVIDQNVGRYVYPLEEGGVDEKRIAFWSVDSVVQEAFTFDLILKSSWPIKDIRMPGHSRALLEKVAAEEPEINEKNGHVYHARIESVEGSIELLDDLVFYYRLDDTVPARVELIPYKAGSDSNGSFMMTITPGVSLASISEGVDWVFVLDKSGSMGGGKIQTLADGVARVIGKMTMGDRFRIITFNDKAKELTRGFVDATPENVARALELLKSISADGGTALHAGLQLGLDEVESDRTSSIILVTDGVANVGPTEHRDFLELLDKKDVRLFTFVIGNSGNTPLLDTLANASGGFSMDISNRDDIYGKIVQAKSKVLYEAMHDVQVKISGGNVTELTPVEPGSLYRGQQLVMFGQYSEPGPVNVSLSAKISGERQEWSFDTSLPEIDLDNPEIERLWALSAIEERMAVMKEQGESGTLRAEVVALATNYSLVSDYTSMVVVDEQEMAELGLQRNNRQRVNKERGAQQQRESKKIKKYRVDTGKDGGMFKGAPSPGVGSGPVGPWFLLVVAGCGWLVRRKR